MAMTPRRVWMPLPLLLSIAACATWADEDDWALEDPMSMEAPLETIPDEPAPLEAESEPEPEPEVAPEPVADPPQPVASNDEPMSVDELMHPERYPRRQRTTRCTIGSELGYHLAMTEGRERPEPSELRRALKANVPAARACSETVGTTPPEVVRVRLRFSGYTGKVESAEPVDAARATALGRCVARALSATTVRRFRRESTTVVFPVRWNG